MTFDWRSSICQSGGCYLGSGGWWCVLSIVSFVVSGAAMRWNLKLYNFVYKDKVPRMFSDDVVEVDNSPFVKDGGLDDDFASVIEMT